MPLFGIGILPTTGEWPSSTGLRCGISLYFLGGLKFDIRIISYYALYWNLRPIALNIETYHKKIL